MTTIDEQLHLLPRTDPETQARVVGPAGLTVAVNVRRLRTRDRLTQAELSSRLADVGIRIASGSVSDIERGTRRVDIDELDALCQVFRVAVDELLNADGGPRPEVPLTDPMWCTARYYGQMAEQALAAAKDDPTSVTTWAQQAVGWAGLAAAAATLEVAGVRALDDDD